MSWPSWWEWELELSSHPEKRMNQRDFTEIDLQAMLHRATGYRPDVEPGRWIIETRHRGSAWEVIVEPECEARCTVVVTAYPIA